MLRSSLVIVKCESLVVIDQGRIHFRIRCVSQSLSTGTRLCSCGKPLLWCCFLNYVNLRCDGLICGSDRLSKCLFNDTCRSIIDDCEFRVASLLSPLLSQGCAIALVVVRAVGTVPVLVHMTLRIVLVVAERYVQVVVTDV